MADRRAKRKRRSRTSGSGGSSAPTSTAAPAPKRADRRLEKIAATAPPPAPKPHRFDVRHGVARPQPPWAPFPLSELALLIGIVIFLIGVLGGGDRGAVLIGVGALVLTVAVTELCLREHFAGFRSHSMLLALLPVGASHTLIYFLITDSWRGPVAFFIDLSVFGMLALFLHSRYRSAHVRARATSR